MGRRQALLRVHTGGSSQRSQPYLKQSRPLFLAALAVAFWVALCDWVVPCSKQDDTLVPRTVGSLAFASWNPFVVSQRGRLGWQGRDVRVTRVRRLAAVERTEGFQIELSAERDEVNKAIFALQMKDSSTTWQWCKFCSEAGSDTYDRTAVDLELLKRFLTAHGGGELQPVDVPNEKMMEYFHSMQKDDPKIAWHWAEYINSDAVESFGIRDPSKLPYDLVDEFMRVAVDGQLPPIELAVKDIVSELYTLKRRMGKDAWRRLTTQYTLGIQDPRSFVADAAEAILAESRQVAQAEREKRQEKGKEVGGSPSKRLLHTAVMKALRRNPLVEDVLYKVEKIQKVKGVSVDGTNFTTPASWSATVEVTNEILEADQRNEIGSLIFTEKANNKKQAVDNVAAAALEKLFPAEKLGTRLGSKKNKHDEHPMRQRLSNAVMKALPRNPRKEDIRYQMRYPKKAPFVATVYLTEDVREMAGDVELVYLGTPCKTENGAKDAAAGRALNGLVGYGYRTSESTEAADLTAEAA